MTSGGEAVDRICRGSAITSRVCIGGSPSLLPLHACVILSTGMSWLGCSLLRQPEVTPIPLQTLNPSSGRSPAKHPSLPEEVLPWFSAAFLPNDIFFFLLKLLSDLSLLHPSSRLPCLQTTVWLQVINCPFAGPRVLQYCSRMPVGV